MPTLTSKQTLIYNFLKTTIRQRGYPPTVREICDAVNLSSTSTVHAHLESLERKGYIKRSPSQKRSVEILEEGFYSQMRGIVNVPIISNITVGVPILSEQNIEDTFPLPVDFVKNSDTFMISCTGSNAASQGIFEGDLLLIHPQQAYAESDFVLILEKKSISCTKFSASNKTFTQKNFSPSTDPVQESQILGKIISLYRRY